MAEKADDKISSTALHLFPVFEELFSQVIIDCVSPFQMTKSGNKYMLAIMCVSSRFPNTILMRNNSAKNIVKALTNFFAKVGLPNVI